MRTKTTRAKTGDKFGNLTLLEILPPRQLSNSNIAGRPILSKMGRWRCDCGNEKTIPLARVMSGRTRSCGCLLHQRGEAWREARRDKTPKPRNIPVPVYLVRSMRLTDGDDDLLYEVYNPVKEFVVWKSAGAVDVQYDMSNILCAFIRKDGDAWTSIAVPVFAELLLKMPGMRVWTRECPPPADPEADGWEVVTC